MPFDAQGKFSRVMNWQEDAANNIPILATRHDDEDDNFANGFSETLCRDGRAAMTGTLRMGGNKIANIANGTADGDAINKSQLDSVQTTLQTSINSKADSSTVVKLTSNQTVAGTKTFSSSPIVPTASSDDNSQKSASTAFIKNVLSTNGNGLASYSKNQNGYFKFSNGLIIQWGKGASGTDTEVTLPTAFTSTNYAVTITSIGSSGVYQRLVRSVTKTKFVTYAGGGAASDDFYWLAIGY